MLNNLHQICSRSGSTSRSLGRSGLIVRFRIVRGTAAVTGCRVPAQSVYPGQFFVSPLAVSAAGEHSLFDSGQRRLCSPKLADAARANLTGGIPLAAAQSTARSGRERRRPRTWRRRRGQVVNIVNGATGAAWNIEAIDAERNARDTDNEWLPPRQLSRARLDLLIVSRLS